MSPDEMMRLPTPEEVELNPEGAIQLYELAILRGEPAGAAHDLQRLLRSRQDWQGLGDLLTRLGRFAPESGANAEILFGQAAEAYRKHQQSDSHNEGDDRPEDKASRAEARKFVVNYLRSSKGLGRVLRRLPKSVAGVRRPELQALVQEAQRDSGDIFTIQIGINAASGAEAVGVYLDAARNRRNPTFWRAQWADLAILLAGRHEMHESVDSAFDVLEALAPLAATYKEQYITCLHDYADLMHGAGNFRRSAEAYQRLVLVDPSAMDLLSETYDDWSLDPQSVIHRDAWIDELIELARVAERLRPVGVQSERLDLALELVLARPMTHREEHNALDWLGSWAGGHPRAEALKVEIEQRRSKRFDEILKAALDDNTLAQKGPAFDGAGVVRDLELAGATRKDLLRLLPEIRDIRISSGVRLAALPIFVEDGSVKKTLLVSGRGDRASAALDLEDAITRSFAHSTEPEERFERLLTLVTLMGQGAKLGETADAERAWLNTRWEPSWNRRLAVTAALAEIPTTARNYVSRDDFSYMVAELIGSCRPARAAELITAELERGGDVDGSLALLAANIWTRFGNLAGLRRVMNRIDGPNAPEAVVWYRWELVEMASVVHECRVSEARRLEEQDLTNPANLEEAFDEWVRWGTRADVNAFLDRLPPGGETDGLRDRWKTIDLLGSATVANDRKLLQRARFRGETGNAEALELGSALIAAGDHLEAEVQLSALLQSEVAEDARSLLMSLFTSQFRHFEVAQLRREERLHKTDGIDVAALDRETELRLHVGDYDGLLEMAALTNNGRDLPWTFTSGVLMIVSGDFDGLWNAMRAELARGSNNTLCWITNCYTSNHDRSVGAGFVNELGAQSLLDYPSIKALAIGGPGSVATDRNRDRAYLLEQMIRTSKQLLPHEAADLYIEVANLHFEFDNQYSALSVMGELGELRTAWELDLLPGNVLLIERCETLVETLESRLDHDDVHATNAFVEAVSTISIAAGSSVLLEGAAMRAMNENRAELGVRLIAEAQRMNPDEDGLDGMIGGGPDVPLPDDGSSGGAPVPERGQRVVGTEVSPARPTDDKGGFIENLFAEIDNELGRHLPATPPPRSIPEPRDKPGPPDGRDLDGFNL